MQINFKIPTPASLDASKLSMGREGAPVARPHFPPQTPPNPPTTLYKGQDAVALNLYYNYGAASRT
nr:hypothetical protein [uncultured Campylobacter sp.]